MSRRVHAFDALVPLAATQFVGLVCGVVGVRWSSTVIPPEVFGLYGLLLSTTQLGYAVTHQGALKHVQRYWTPAVQPREFLAQMSRGMGSPLLWLAAGAAAVLIFLHAISGLPLSLAILAWIIVINLLSIGSVAAQTALQAENRYWAAFAISATGSLTRSLLPPLLATLLAATLSWLAVGYLVHVVAQVALAVAILAASWTRAGAVPPEAADTLPRTMRAFAVAGLCAWLAAAAPRWLAAAILNAEEVGYFMLAANLTLIVPATFGTIAQNYSFPKLFAAARDGATPRALLSFTNRTLAVVLIGSQLALLALLWVAPLLVGVVIHARYADAIGWLLAAGGATLAATTTQFYHNLLLSRDRESDCQKLSILSGVFRIALMAAAMAANVTTFRIVLIVLPWLTAGLECWYAARRIQPATS